MCDVMFVQIIDLYWCDVCRSGLVCKVSVAYDVFLSKSKRLVFVMVEVELLLILQRLGVVFSFIKGGLILNTDDCAFNSWLLGFSCVCKMLRYIVKYITSWPFIFLWLSDGFV